MHGSSFHPGQRWVSNTESELGLGIVLSAANRRVELSFPAAEENRTYAIDNAPLSRVHYEIDQQVSNVDGQRLTISEIEEHNGCLIYLGADEDGNVMVLPESELDSFVQFSKPQERLFAGQVDGNRAFQLRLQTLNHYRRLQQSSVAGLLGARIELLPHQLYIANETANRFAPRVLLADEVGLGKTIEAGLIIHQQLITGRASRVLIAVPDSLVHQWLVEMLRRFNLMFTIMDEERCQALMESGTNNPYEGAQLVLSPMSLFSEQVERVEQAASASWDLLVVDEAHHLEWTEQHASPAYQAVKTLAQTAKGLLLLTATPEQLGLQGHFARLRLLDPDRYFDIGEFRKEEARYTPVNKLVQTLLSDNNLEHISDAETQQQLQEFLGQTTLDTLNKELDETGSDHDAIQDQLVRELLDRHGTGRVLFRNTRVSVKGFPERKFHPHPLPLPVAAGQSQDAGGDEVEPSLLPERLWGSEWLHTDIRVTWLVDFLEQHRREKILVICAQAETALELEQHLILKHGVHASVFHEGLSLVARDRAAAYFADKDQGAQVLICSEIGSEGRNFQFSSQLVLFDLPLNPDLLEQRIGRLDRIGQQHDVQIHVPYYERTSQHVLLRWYHEGVNAFEHTCAIGQAMFRQFETELVQCLSHPEKQADIDSLLSRTREAAQALVSELSQGRDRLLELNSCDPERAEQIVNDLHDLDHDRALPAYMERVFDLFGVEQEHHTTGSIIIRPGEHMIGHHFPGLPEEGITATFRRDIALAREDFQFLTWEHPMVTGAMDMVMSGELGNTAFCALKLPLLKPGTILLEAMFTSSSPAPHGLQLHRYLPLTTIRVVVDSKQNDLSAILTEKHFSKLGQKVRRHQAQEFIRHARRQINPMIETAEQLAADQEKALVEAAQTKMEEMQRSELQRLQALAKVNPNIRQEEISYLTEETNQLAHFLEHTYIKLEALRVAVVSQ